MIPLTVDQIADAVAALPRPLLVRLIDRAVERLDAMDGDADEEPEVDEDGHDAEAPGLMIGAAA